jgi:hypothetical protein
MEEIGADIHHLLEKIHQSSLPELAELHEVKMLDQVWVQQFKALESTAHRSHEDPDLRPCGTCAYHGTERRHYT